MHRSRPIASILISTVVLLTGCGAPRLINDATLPTATGDRKRIESAWNAKDILAAGLEEIPVVLHATATTDVTGDFNVAVRDAVLTNLNDHAIASRRFDVVAIERGDERPLPSSAPYLLEIEVQSAEVRPDENVSLWTGERRASITGDSAVSKIESVTRVRLYEAVGQRWKQIASQAGNHITKIDSGGLKVRDLGEADPDSESGVRIAGRAFAPSEMRGNLELATIDALRNLVTKANAQLLPIAEELAGVDTP